MTRQPTLAVALLIAVLLAACGGGDSTLPSSPCAADAFRVTADPSIPVGKAAGAMLASSCGRVTDVQWRQTAGPTLTLLSARSQAISIEPTVPGSYSFTVDFTDIGAARRSLSVTINALFPVSPVAIVVRSDQAVREGGSASVRAWPGATAGETITWTQVSGPAVAFDTTNTDQNRVLFTAPAVTEDTVVVLRATRQLIGGGTDSDDVRVLVENYEQAPPDPGGTGAYVFSDFHVSRVYPYRANGQFASALVACTYEANLQYFGTGANVCPLSKLPFLHQTTGGGVPTVSQIMDRVAVSHDWMGQVFEEFLTTQANDDLKRLLNGVTAIVIGAHVRPSFYYALTGAIYLDADSFWLTADQRDVIDEKPDFRSDFDRLLNYSSVWRYTENNQSIFVNFPATTRIPRAPSYLLAEAGWLLYHELGHASDFVPPGVRSSLNSSLSVWGNISPRFESGTLPSDDLSRNLPLFSAEMRALAEVKFVGVAPTPAQIAYTPDTVASFFAPDRATDEYNFHPSTREDLAMLFEEFMMFRNHAWRRDMAITDKITDTTTSSTLIVRWGQRGRVGAAAVKPRVQLVVGALAPWVSLAEVTSLPPPIQMRPGESWAGNLIQPAPPAGLASALSVRGVLDFEADRASLLRDLGGRHGHWTPNDRWLRRAGR
jgi:hypothetical protein